MIPWPLDLIQYGSVPDWLAALGTIGAMVAALVLLQKEQAAQQARDEDVRREQARLVWALVREGSSGYEVTVANDSAQPIYDCGVSADDGRSVVPGIMEPRSRVMQVWARDKDLDPKLKTISSNALPITLTFRDANGLRWKRGPFGVLERFDHDHIF